MRKFCFMTLAVLTFALTSASAQTIEAQLSVSAKMDIYRAGGYDDSSDGTSPAVYAFAARFGRAIVFRSVTGLWNCNYAIPPYGADGTNSGPCNDAGGQAILNPLGPFAGYGETNFVGAMAGVFLEDELPLDPPPGPLDFQVKADVPPGHGIPTGFSTSTPRIGQVFFIGDGLRGNGTGNPQLFLVPPTATHLYLGYVDTCTGPAPAVPGCYSDNTGVLSASFVVFSLAR